ncbi:transporter substrate-binding domain-containing protein [Zooshikella harenae]|uniref:Transporter substrate-binding domain-containing protein n=1 Tax=Zooshikella harenae TaxID=2827238 RepID=A0ABS5ZFJ5_9GAMM|nr:transporter substrate-binding domain-containing protein [Zooshikella harenae]MBU2712051.1 transporter substrate-binding domain-containing protein [Zooshikella harenae]
MKKIIFLMSLLCAVNGYGDDWSMVKERGILRVGTTGDYAPISFTNNDGKLQGFAIDMAESLGKALSLKVVFIKTSWPTLSKDLANNKFDIAMGGITYTKDRANAFLLTSKVIDNGKIALVRCEDSIQYTSEKVINNASVKVVVNPGGTNERFVKSRLINSTVINAKDNFVPFGMLLSKQADVMVTDLIEGRYQSRLHQNKLCVANAQPFVGTESYKVYMVQKDSKILLTKVNDWLSVMEIDALKRKWKIDP